MLTPADQVTIAAVIDSYDKYGPAMPDPDAAACLYEAFADRGRAVLYEAFAHADELWKRRHALTAAQLDECIRLKTKGFGGWDDHDLTSLADLTYGRPHVRDLLLPG